MGDEGIRLFTEIETEGHCEIIFDSFEEMNVKNISFEEIILKYALRVNETVIQTASFLYNLFTVILYFLTNRA